MMKRWDPWTNRWKLLLISWWCATSSATSYKCGTCGSIQTANVGVICDLIVSVEIPILLWYLDKGSEPHKEVQGGRGEICLQCTLGCPVGLTRIKHRTHVEHRGLTVKVQVMAQISSKKWEDTLKRYTQCLWFLLSKVFFLLYYKIWIWKSVLSECPESVQWAWPELDSENPTRN